MNTNKIYIGKEYTEEWHAIRKNHITGSDAAIINGSNHYKSIEQLFLEKTNQIETKIIDNAAIRKGQALEPILIDLYRETKQGLEITTKKEYFFENKDYPFIGGNLDAFIENDGILEIKTSTIKNPKTFELWGGFKFPKIEGQSIPGYYYDQLLHYLLLTGLEYAVLFAWLDISFCGKTELREYVIHREDVLEELDLLLKKETEFFKKIEEYKNEG